MRLVREYILFFIFLSINLVGQNLVSNPNFEVSKIHPTSENQLELATGWYNPNRGTADLFCDDAKPRENGIPKNFQGQQKLKTGKHYAGIIVFSDDDYKKYTEYIACELTQELINGRNYKISFYTSLSENSSRAVSGLGAVLSNEKLTADHNHFIRLKPNIFSNEIIKDTANWVEVSGTYLATGGEKHITIGLFTNNKWKKQRTIKQGITDTRRGYYYISDVLVEEINNNTFGTPSPAIIDQYKK